MFDETGNEDEIEALRALSKRILDSLLSVSESAKKELAAQSSGLETLAQPGNPLARTNLRGREHLAATLAATRSDLRHLTEEPFVARSIVRSDGESRTIYFSRFGTPRKAPGELDGEIASYRGPFGRLAELPPGESGTIRIPRGDLQFEIDQRVRVHPVLDAGDWDARNNAIESSDRAITLESLRQFLDQTHVEPVPEDHLAKIEAEANRERAATLDRRRHLVSRISLRDQPILDKHQGEIFRSPLDRRLFLLGPPGTGKTTTLIRRLAQKRRFEELTDDEQELISDDEVLEFFHDDNWVMFVPTELLKLYVKEAFSREGVAASDARVRTWSSERRRLSRDVFRILRSSIGGQFTLDEKADFLVDASSHSHAELADEFSRFVIGSLSERYGEAATALALSPQPEVREVGNLLARRLGQPPIEVERILGLLDVQEELGSCRQELEARVETVLRREINLLLGREPSLLDHLAAHLRSLESPTEEDVDEEEDDDETPAQEAGPRLLAAKALRRALRSRALAISRGRTIAPESSASLVLGWLGRRAPSDGVLRPLGVDLVAVRHLRFASAVRRNLVDGIPQAFQRFRREALRAERHYRVSSKTAIDRLRISELEVDVVLREMLRNTRRLEARRRELSPADQSAIDRLATERVTQVLVDEATDFSPVELACMLELANPRFRSFFLAGDPRQRVTVSGLQSLDELAWISADFDISEVRIGYRQTAVLTALADEVAAIGGLPPTGSLVPTMAGETPVPPLLAERVVGSDAARWLAARIWEIEAALGQVPSIAIFVDGDDRVDPLVQALRLMLEERNLEVVGCREGRVVGDEAQVRVFDVQYIKGLEFEAVFFVGVDGLVSSKPGLYDKFLFLGITRAATYLGLTCEGELPNALERLRPLLSTGSWAQEAV